MKMLPLRDWTISMDYIYFVNAIGNPKSMGLSKKFEAHVGNFNNTINMLLPYGFLVYKKF